MVTRLTLAAVLLFCVGASPALFAKEPDNDIHPTSDPGGGLKLRLVCGNSATDTRLAKLKDYPEIEVLSIFGSADFSDRGLENLKSLPKLRSLSLGGLHLTAAGLESIRGSQALKSLQLTGMPLSKRVAELIASLTNLETLNIYPEGVEPGSWQLIAQLPHLQNLYIQNTLDSAEPADLDGVEAFTQLRKLDLVSNGFGNDCVARFTANSHLRELTLSRIHISDENAAALGKFSELQTLRFNQTAPSAAAVQVLRELPQLRHLSIYSDDVKDENLLLYEQFHRLRTLEFSSHRLTEGPTHTLRQKLHNTVVNRFRWKHTVADLQAMAREVELNDAGEPIYVELICHEFATDAKLAVLQQFPTIERLELAGSDMSDAGLHELHALKNLRELTLISRYVTDAGLKHLGTNNSELKRIHLRTQATTPAGVAWLKEKLPAAEITIND